MKSVKNQLDKRLIARTVRLGSYPRFIDNNTSDIPKHVMVEMEQHPEFEPRLSLWNKTQALKRDTQLSKRLLDDLKNPYKKVTRDFSDFIDLCEDLNPEYCFLCGRYVIPKMRTDTSRIKRPYKNKDPCHEYCFGKEMTVDRSLGKINLEAELICHVELGEDKKGSVCRQRVTNIIKDVFVHLRQHGVIHEKGTPFQYYQTNYFLKPNGKHFQKRLKI